MDKIINKLKTNAWLRYGLIVLVAFGAGLAAAEPEPTVRTETKEVVKEVKVPVETTVSPASCKRAIEIDNAVFIMLSERLPELDFEGIVSDLEQVQAERVRVAGECLNN